MKIKENELIKDLREKQLKTKEAFEDNARKSKLYSDMKTLLIIKYHKRCYSWLPGIICSVGTESSKYRNLQ